MNKRALIIGLLYSTAVIIFKLVILLGGYFASDFGFYYSHILSVFLILPFLFLAVQLVREKELGGFIGGREAVRIALTVVAVSAILLSIYNYIEFSWKGSEMAQQYYNSPQYLEVLKKQQLRYPDKIKVEDFPKIVREQVEGQSAQSPFKATTAKLVPLIFIGLTGSLIVSVFMKRSSK